MALKFSADGIVIFNSLAFCIMPVAIGCSDFCSKADAKRIISFSLNSFCTETTFDTSNLPIVSVPVLSKTMVVMRRAFSKAVLFLMSNPLCAESAVDLATTKGTAKPKACGQQITITVTMRSMANAKVSPVMYQ